MNARIAFTVLKKHAFLIARVTALAMLLALAASYMLSEKYEATTVVQLQPTHASTTSSPQETAAFLGADDPYATLAETNSRLIESRRVAEYVVETLDLESREPGQTPVANFKRWVKQSLRDIWTFLKYGYVRKADTFDGLVGDIEKAVTVDVVKPTYLIAVTAKAPSPDLAAQIASTTVDGFAQVRRDAMQAEADNSLALMDKQLSQSERVLQSAQRALANFQKRKHVASLPEEVASRIQGIIELEISTTRRGAVSTVKRKAARKLIAKHRAYLATVPEIQMELAALLRKVDAASQDYETLLDDRQETARDAASYLGEMTVVDAAHPPLYPVAPIRVYWGGLAALLGFAFACGFVLVRERLGMSATGDEDPEDREGQSANRTAN